ncbi:cystine/glutamate transporter-like [Amphiura filiformis]|uniref:cystine/glutamate transporter-like n=1 Tax=Amphiura filiformis TaxID=82378 RepID=UPI003B216BAB
MKTMINRSPVQLKRQLGLWSCIALVVGQVIGSGIFIAPKGVLKYSSGSVGWALLIWIGCGVISTIGALCFAELATIFSKSGGDFVYIAEAYNKLLGFLRVWTFVIAIKPGAFAIISLTMSNYLVAPFISSDCQDVTGKAVILIAVCALCLVIFVNCISVQWASRIQIIFTVIKVLGLLFIICIGMVRLAQGHTANFAKAFDSIDDMDLTKVPLAFYSGLFAYAGWHNLPQVTEEIENPSRNIPLSIIISMTIVSVIYTLTNVAYFTGLSSEELLQSNAVAVSFAKPVLGSWTWIIQIIVALSCAGALNGGFLTAARVPFAASRKGLFPDIFAMINIRYRTPIPSLCFIFVICVLTLSSNDVLSLINYLSFTRWVFLAIVVIIIPFYRWKYPDMKRPFKVPLLFPILFIITSLYIVGVSLYSAPVDCGIGLLITLVGVPLYLVGVTWRAPQRLESIKRKATHLLQKTFVAVHQEVKMD